MRDRRKRSGFGHAVALNDGVTDSSPKCLHFFFKRRASADERPQSPTEAAMNTAKRPPVLQEVPVFGCLKSVREIAIVSEDFLAERLQHARHGYYRVDVLLPRCLHDLRRLERLQEVNFTANDLRHKDPHQLSKHVTQR